MTQDIASIIAPPIRETYGCTAMAEALIHHLAGRVEHDWQGYRARQHQIMLTCWDWFTGGTTAEAVASRIEEALREAGI